MLPDRSSSSPDSVTDQKLPSTSPSPASSPPSHASLTDDDDDLAYDGLDASPDSTIRPSTFVSPDIQRLRRDHSQQGYLEGVTSGKPSSVQKGFDDGYPLGSEIGLCVGRIIGILQGLRGFVSSQAASGTSKSTDNELAKVERVERHLRAELMDLPVLFGDKYWAVNKATGEVLPRWISGSNGLSIERDENAYFEAVREMVERDPGVVARSHPLVQSWILRIEELRDSILST
ncbi:hypothetical protein BZA70DRAFT_286900 [Myxozyma melibiosi]|uniref:Protein YAE1 n=1 Tax=Myxozyma melibiosi TaxID=54550 RepID=A0ABR1FCG7_9ASCO